MFLVAYNGTIYCKPKHLSNNNDKDDDDDDDDDDEDEIDNNDILHFDLKVLCTQPRLIAIENLLTADECQHIIQVGSFIGLKRSTITESALQSIDRTSSTVWIERDHSPIIDEINRRIANLIRVDQRLLFLNASAESLQLVYYNSGDLYKPHHDYGTDSPNNRFITFLMYLNTPAYGGNTSFPDAHSSCRDHNGYFGIRPKQGSGIFFYDLHPDGNVDESTLHYAEPPTNDSIKWMTNLWIWDPAFIKS